MLNHNILLIPLFIALALFFSKKLRYRSFILFTVIFLIFIRDFQHKIAIEDHVFHQSIRFIMFSFLLLSLLRIHFYKIINRMFTPIGIFGVYYLFSYLWAMFQEVPLINVLGDLLIVFIIALIAEKVSDLKEVIYAFIIFIILGAAITFLPIINKPELKYLASMGEKENIFFTNPLACEVVWMFALCCITTFLVKVPQKYQLLAVIGLIGCLAAFVIIQSRTEMIGLFVASIVALIINRKWFFVLFVSTLAIVIIYYGNELLTIIYPEVIQRKFLLKLTIEDETRFWAWSIALQKVLESPLIGSGIGTDSLLSSEMGTHSGILTILVNTGIAGLILFSYAVIWALRKHWFYMKNATSQLERWYFTLMFIGLISYVSRMLPNGTLFGPFLIISLVSADNIYFKKRFYESTAKNYHVFTRGAPALNRILRKN